METNDTTTRRTRRALGEVRSRGNVTTIEVETTNNPSRAQAQQDGQRNDSGGDTDNELAEGTVAFDVAPSAPRPRRFNSVRTPKQKSDTILAASEEEEVDERGSYPVRRTRKLSAKARQNGANQDVVGLMRSDDGVGMGQQATPGHIQEQLREQTGILKALRSRMRITRRWKQNLSA